MKNLALSVLLAATTTIVSAETYNVESEISFTTKDYFGQDIDSSLLDVTYYFKDIDNSKGPLAEAAFLNKNSEVSVKYGKASQEYLDNYTTWGLAGRYVADTGFLIGFNYLNKGISPIYGEEAIIDTGYLEVGGYLSDVSTLTLSVSDNQKDVFGEDNIISNTLGIRYNHLFLMGSDTSIKLNSRLAYNIYQDDKYSSDDFYIIDLGADYYFNRQLSAGVEFMKFETSTGNSAQKYGIKSIYFITDTVSVSGGWSFTDVKDFSEGANSLSIALNARF
jgi:hypothetical protein